MPVFLGESGDEDAVALAAVVKLGCNIVPDRTLAKVFVVKGAADLGTRARRHAALGWIHHNT